MREGEREIGLVGEGGSERAIEPFISMFLSIRASQVSEITDSVQKCFLEKGSPYLKLNAQ